MIFFLPGDVVRNVQGARRHSAHQAAGVQQSDSAFLQQFRLLSVSSKKMVIHLTSRHRMRKRKFKGDDNIG